MRKRTKPSVDNAVERLPTPDDPKHQDSSFGGVGRGTSANPALLPDNLGESGLRGGEAARSGTNESDAVGSVFQRLLKNGGPIVILDCKGDETLLTAMKRAVETMSLPCDSQKGDL